MQINGKEIFNKGGLMFNLSRMASLEYQDKYLIHITNECYEDPAEMIDWLYDFCKMPYWSNLNFASCHTRGMR